TPIAFRLPASYYFFRGPAESAGSSPCITDQMSSPKNQHSDGNSAASNPPRWNRMASSRVSKRSTRSAASSLSSHAAQRPSGSFVTHQSMSPSETMCSEASINLLQLSNPRTFANVSSAIVSSSSNVFGTSAPS